MKRPKLKGKRAVVRWLKFFRWKKKKDYERMTAEEKILYKLRKVLDFGYFQCFYNWIFWLITSLIASRTCSMLLLSNRDVKINQCYCRKLRLIMFMPLNV